VRRLSYADRKLVVALGLLGIIASTLLGYSIFKDSLGYARALGDQYVSDEIYYVDVARRILINVFHVRGVHWFKWSGETESTYYNPEHPPLGKYIIGLSMILCGDKPVCWRVPGVIEASLIPVILYLAYYLTHRQSYTGVAAGLAASLAVSSSLSLRYEASVAMLDIHQAFFSSLAIASLVAERPLLAAFMIGLAGSVKYSGLFLVPALWAYPLIKDMPRRERAIIFLESILIPIIVIVALSSPLIIHFGFKWFWDNAVIGAISWHTQSRPPGPPVSSPGGWLINANPFYFDYNTMIGGVANSLLHIAALAVGAIVIIYASSRNGWPAAGSLSLYSILAMYLLLSNLGALHIPGVKGNKTLYSFYLVQLVPASAAVYGDAVAVRGEP
jgi:predicted membrane-bound dolichyl-phosphate-mannose-protein mannosyltransferase